MILVSEKFLISNRFLSFQGQEKQGQEKAYMFAKRLDNFSSIKMLLRQSTNFYWKPNLPDCFFFGI